MQIIATEPFAPCCAIFDETLKLNSGGCRICLKGCFFLEVFKGELPPRLCCFCSLARSPRTDSGSSAVSLGQHMTPHLLYIRPCSLKKCTHQLTLAVLFSHFPHLPSSPRPPALALCAGALRASCHCLSLVLTYEFIKRVSAVRAGGFGAALRAKMGGDSSLCISGSAPCGLLALKQQGGLVCRSRYAGSAARQPARQMPALP